LRENRSKSSPSIALRDLFDRQGQLARPSAEKDSRGRKDAPVQITLFAADFAYSSWSLRGWLLLRAFGMDFRLRRAALRTPAFERMKSEMAPARTVPAMRIASDDHEDVIVWDSLAMAETLAELGPNAGHWPRDPSERATARSIAAEMHSGFGALRSECPMNMRRAYIGFEASEAVRADLARLGEIWAHARAVSATGPYLFGRFTAADAFFAPVASRIATYDLPTADDDRAYVAALLSHEAVRDWYAEARADASIQPHYEMDLPARPNPHDQP